MEIKTPLEYAKLGADTIINKYSVSELPPPDRFHYHQGVFLAGVEQLYNITGDEKYYDYIKDWVDYYIDKDGNCKGTKFDQFDDMQPAMLLFGLYDKTGDNRYKIMLDKVIDFIEAHPKNAKGGVWHKLHLKNQMWLDSMYMMGMITVMYALRFDRPYLVEVVHQQMKLMYDNMRNGETGLLYHAWDDSKQARWADKETGCSPEHWGRAMGWYVVAVTEIASMLPDGYIHKNDFVKTSQDILKNVIKYQTENGLWYQILDKGDNPSNWHETSCSALFTYALAKAISSGILDTSYEMNMRKGYEGVISKTKTTDGLEIDGICIGTGVGPERFYFDRPTVSTDLHGMGAFLMMCSEIHKRSDEVGKQN